jgi:DNA-binding PadR family transcriptional regulator
MAERRVRKRMSSLGYAILALVATKPQSGYDVARQMKSPLGFLWQARHGQIYPELARLEASGLVDMEQLDQTVRPPRKVYGATAAGRAELTTWIAQLPQERPANDEMVVKAFALRRISGSAAAKMLQAQIETHQGRLAALEQRARGVEARSGFRIGLDSTQFGNYAALRRAIGSEREYISWCHWLLGEVSPKTRMNPRVRKSAARGGRRRTVAAK